MRRIATIATLALISSLVFSAPVASAACGADVYLRNFRLSIEPSSDSYRMGELANIKLTLTRKESGLPVEGADIAIGVWQDDRLNYDTGMTDLRGEWIAIFKLDRPDFRPGPVRASAYGTRKTGDSTLCAAVVEYGYKKDKALFTIHR